MKFQVYFVMLCLSYPQVKYSGKKNCNGLTTPLY